MSRDTDWAALYGDNSGDNSGDDSGGRSRPPIWVVVVVVAAVVTGGWLLVTQGSSDRDPVAGTTIPFEPLVVETTTTSVATTTASTVAGDAVSVFGNPPAAVTAETPQQLRGYVAVTSPDDPPFLQYTVWMFRPGGSMVSRADNVIGRGNVEYPMLMTAGRLTLGGRIFDIDLAEPPISLWTNGSVIPGSEPGVVWLTQRVERITDDSLWVSPVNVETLTVGERIEVTDVFSRAIVGVADGLIVVPLKEAARWQNGIAFWSPTHGLENLGMQAEVDTGSRVVAASGDLVVVASAGGRLSLWDVATGEDRFLFDMADIVTAACLSPDQQHVIVVGRTGKAAVGNTTTGQVVDLNEAIRNYSLISVQPKNGIGWTTDDQLVLVGEGAFSEHAFGFDIETGEGFAIAELDGPEEWRLTTSGTMC